MTRRALALCVLAATLTGCSVGGGHSGSGDSLEPRPIVDLRPEPVAIDRLVLRRPLGDEQEPLGPELLRVGPREDLPVGEVEGQTIYRSQVFDRMLESDLLQAASWVDSVLLDQAIAALAQDQGVRLDRGRVDRSVSEIEERLRTQLAIETEQFTIADDEFEQSLASRFGLSVEGYRAAVRRDVARQQLRDGTVRLISWRSPRVTLRCLFSSDRTLIEEARESVSKGASLQAIADRLRREHGGIEAPRLGPFGPEFRHPVAERGIRMQPGDLSEVLELSGGRFGLLLCLERGEARSEEFGELAEELWEDLERRPIEEFEQRAFALRYGGYETSLPGASDGR